MTGVERNRLRLIMRRSKLHKARKEAEKAGKKGGTSGGVKRLMSRSGVRLQARG